MSWYVKTLNSTVDKELGLLDASLKARFFHICELLEINGPTHMGMPYVRHLTGRLWEMRMKGKSGIARAIYLVVAEKRIVIVHIFVKKTRKTPRAAIGLAFARSKGLMK